MGCGVGCARGVEGSDIVVSAARRYEREYGVVGDEDKI